ncbi:TIGR03086 family metal-binding protein [Streptomyces sp. MZ04]|uniref:TIGR03086 family metal-binding protein n=1 Tax=Streptomyces sp. MZ04 TaxID=2559236 RepID=UPI00107E8D28|nr:TIGR03086 family metal-binding protein [Streptomyces sp. MZ04]TGA88177.1 TIGR03086 family protein [Streptomyces sp. MZ04]
MNASPDPRPLFARATDQVAALIATVRPEQLDAATPCDEYDVRRLISHLVGGTRRFQVVGEGGDGLAVTPYADDVPDDGFASAYEKGRTAALDAWADDARLDAQVRVPWGDAPGRIALTGYVMETVTHTWDLSEALGRPLELDQELARFALGFAHQALPAEGRGEGVPFGAVQEVAEGADAYGELAAWLGRTPLEGTAG